MIDFLYNKSIIPNDKMLAGVMGKSFDIWTDMKTFLEETHGPLVEEWKFYGQKIGWTFKLLLKKRNLFFFKPCEKYFRLTFVFGDKAVNEILKSDFSESIKTEIKSARKYVEGRGLSLGVKKSSDIKTVIKLVEIKIKN